MQSKPRGASIFPRLKGLSNIAKSVQSIHSGSSVESYRDF